MKEMIFQRTTDELDSWKNQMKSYQKGKRTKKPFGKQLQPVNRVSYSQVKQKQTQFNPLLQTFKYRQDQSSANYHQQINRVKSLMSHIKNIQKYQKPYDIVNLHSYQNSKPQPNQQNKKIGPIRNAYNVINNQKLPEFYFKGRDIQLPQEREKALIDHHRKEFDIITGDYKHNNQQKQHKQRQEENLHVIDKYWRTHTYDAVYGKFYDPKKQAQYQKHLQQQGKVHGQNVDKKLPASYVYRQPLILDFQKPLPQTLRTLDQRQQNKRKKFHLKYIIQDEYSLRNQQQQENYQKVIKNRVHDGRLLDEKAKEFNIITNNNYPSTRAQVLYGKKPTINRWEEYIKPTDNMPKFIKTSGFK